MVKITYLGHACFRMEYGGQSVVLDPYEDDYVPGLGALRAAANAVYCSHGHSDHNGVEAVLLHPCTPNYTVEELLTDHDPEGGKLRGKNTVHIFHFGGLRVAHLGDLGRLLTFKEIERLKGLDCLLLPVGGTYTINPVIAKSIVEVLQPKVAIPMHYRTDETGFDNIAHIDEFTELFDHVGHTGSSLTLDESGPAGLYVMTPRCRDVAALATDCHSLGYNCAQSVLTSLCRYTGLTEKEALAVSGGFGGGLRSGEVCGAISGAVMALGVCFPYTDGSNKESKEKIDRLTRKCVSECENTCGCVTCRDLLKQEGGKGGCNRFIAECAQIAEKIIIENK